ncbi:NAD(P)-binding protein [Clavulina sp. PMI_390]|nr:NAD(P)-binding protein [Clavulina sp. PMI_390]
MTLSNPSFDEKTTAGEAVSALHKFISRKSIVLVGATVGSFGGEFLRYIAPYPKSIYVLSRNKARIQEAINAALKPLEDDANNTIIHPIEPIDLLMLNQGIPLPPEPSYGPDGFEVVFTGYHLASFLLTSLLLPRLRQAGPGARVVSISSVAHYFADFRWDDANYRVRPEEWDPQKAYGQSKIANALFAKSLAKKLATEKITAITLHPGFVRTLGVDRVPDGIWIKVGLKNTEGEWTELHDKYFRSMEEGVSNLIVAAFDPVVQDHSGEWIEDCQIHNERVAPFVNEENGERLWTMTEEMIGHKFF